MSFPVAALVPRSWLKCLEPFQDRTQCPLVLAFDTECVEIDTKDEHQDIALALGQCEGVCFHGLSFPVGDNVTLIRLRRFASVPF